MLFAALYVRMIRATVTEELSAPYVVTARAKGASEWVVIRRHVLRNALLPVVTMVGMDVAHAIALVVFVERVFELPGLGGILVQAVDRNDLPVTMGIVLFVALAISVLNLLVDVVCALLDPRMNTGWRLRRVRAVERAAAVEPAREPAAVPSSGR
jgi:peptide/nickel transport system permease protein